MPIYIARPFVAGGKTPTEEFEKRGLKNLVQATLSDSGVYGVPLRNQIAYDGYTANFSVFMKACVDQASILTNIEGSYFNTPEKSRPEFENPVTIIVFPKNFSDKTLGAVLNKLDIAKIESKDDNGKVYRSTNLTEKQIQALTTMGCVTYNRTGQGTTNLGGLASFKKTLDILTAALATQFYAGDKGDGSMAVDMVVSGLEKGMKTVKITEEDMEDEEQVASTSTATVVAKKKKGKKTVTNQEIIEDDHIRAFKSTTSIAVARPSIFRPNQNFGPLSRVPNMPGLLFPYFDGMNPSDPTVLPRLMVQNRFMRSFGTDRESVREGFKSYKQGCQTWASTYQGTRLSHAFFCVDLAITCQARPFVIIEDGKYLGTILHGKSFAVFAQNEWHMPLEFSELEKEFTCLSSHSINLEKVRRSLSELQLKDSAGYDANIALLTDEDVDSPRKLYKEIHKRRIDVDVQKDLMQLIQGIRYPDYPYLDITVENLASALEYVCNDSLEIGSHMPMFLADGFAFKTDRISIVWSIFGPTAPSFITSKGDRFGIPHPATKSDPASVVDPSTKLRNLEEIHVGLKSLDIAVADLVAVIKSKSITVNQKQRSGKSKMKVFTHSERDKLWEALRDTIGKGSAKTTAVTKRIAVIDVEAGLELLEDSDEEESDPGT